MLQRPSRLIDRFHKAKLNNSPKVSVWGTGKPRREFLYVDDLARASIHIMNITKKAYEKYTSPMCSHINVGSSKDFTIKEIAKIIKDVVGFKGTIEYDLTKPDGTYRKLLNSKKIKKLRFHHKISLKEGLNKTYQHYKKI